MPIQVNGIYTGMVGYSARNEYFGNFAVQNRKVESFDYEIICSDLTNIEDVSASIYSNLYSLFTGYSRDVNVKVINIPGANTTQEGQTRSSKFNARVEVRNTVSSLLSSYPELSGDYFKGLDDTAINSYSPYWDEFSETITLSKNGDGGLESVHNLNMVLRSGAPFGGGQTPSMAKYIASGIFSADKNISGFGVNTFISGFKNFGDDSTARNLYSETFDLMRNSFAFEKRQNVFPTSGSSYTYDLKHSMNVDEDGVFELVEDINLKGKKSFSEAELGFTELFAGSYGRCNSLFTTFRNQATNSSSFDALISTPLEVRKVINKPALKLDATLKFSNKVGIGTEFTFDDSIVIERDINSTIGMTQTFNYRLLRPVSGNMDEVILTGLGQNMVQFFKDKKTQSQSTCLTYYQNSEFYNASYLGGGLANISSTISTPKRRKDFAASFQYSNNPIYITTLPVLGVGSVTTFKKVEFSINNKKPNDIINEYKIIDRPSQTSVLSYAFQSSEGANSVSVSAQIARENGVNLLTTPSLPKDEVRALYQFARKKLIEMLIGVSATSTFAYSYYLSDFSYSFTSANTINLQATLNYTLKRRPS